MIVEVFLSELALILYILVGIGGVVIICRLAYLLGKSIKRTGKHIKRKESKDGS